LSLVSGTSDFFLLIICPHILALYAKEFLEIKLFTFDIMKTNLREQLTRYQCVIRPKVHFAPEFSYNPVRFLYPQRVNSRYIYSTWISDLNITGFVCDHMKKQKTETETNLIQKNCGNVSKTYGKMNHLLGHKYLHGKDFCTEPYVYH